MTAGDHASDGAANRSGAAGPFRTAANTAARGECPARVTVSLLTDPAENFALERWMMEAGGDHVLLYIDRECVVVGRNQQPEAEANARWCAAEGVPVLRRVSGGGAVWHDGGNVNFAFVSSVGEAGRVEAAAAPLDDRPLGVVVAALGRLGVEARIGGRGELLVGTCGEQAEEWRKVSGTASCVRNGRRLFHGTLLVAADLGRMERALAGDGAKRGRRVASVPSPTANLFDLYPQLSRFRTDSAGAADGSQWTKHADGAADTTENGAANDAQNARDRHATAHGFMERLARSIAAELTSPWDGTT